MSAPWMKFYPSDWRADPALRTCSIAARGLWIEMLCIMHEATPRGALVINNKPITDKQLAGLANVQPKEVIAALAELEEAGVFSRTDDGVIYSRRIMRDEAKAQRDKANGSRGGNPKLRERGLTPPLTSNGGGEDKAQKPEARSQSYPSQVIEFPGDREVSARGWGDDVPFGDGGAA